MQKVIIGSLTALALAINVANAETRTIKMGTVAGPETEVMEVAARIAKEEYDLNVEIIEFTDYVTPNAALADGSLDANAYQHEPYMQAMVNDRGYDFAIAGYTFVYPIGAYSEKYDSIDELPDGAQIALPNDPSNEGRALILMHNEGLITLNDPTFLEATPIDIAENPRNFR
ncbi:MAG: MetQ/NlpA family ABC transporter substrate-binding protein, partial [Pseudomonadota bacterium]|nr:MetQ/NlpA family ABC transporter substrate-binding protein [Pseudomonadota bacterium]